MKHIKIRRTLKASLAITVLIVVALCFQNCTQRIQSLQGANSLNSGVPTVSWSANRETAVNSLGGGYKVYYGTTSGFSLNGASFINVPYVSGTKAPTSVTLPGNIAHGTFYFVVVAYSALNPPGGSSGSVSAPSAQTSMVIP